MNISQLNFREESHQYEGMEIDNTEPNQHIMLPNIIPNSGSAQGARSE
tara:strand:+ start:386 stop:529 length:144 start_codon:yes stop_codon:yes gene_type:complete